MQDVMSKIMDRQALMERAASLRSEGKTLVFTNGCFDILHAGHVRYLSAARNQGDVLMVGLNSDKSVSSIKPKGRPIVSQDHRAEVLASLSCVDYVTFFDEPDPFSLILALAPDVLVKGADWAEEDIVGAKQVRARGGRVVRVDLVPGISTSDIIRRIKERFC
jgi:rfaE bifunctional protein nucleotidyltransferase chain/domain